MPKVRISCCLQYLNRNRNAVQRKFRRTVRRKPARQEMRVGRSDHRRSRLASTPTSWSSTPDSSPRASIATEEFKNDRGEIEVKPGDFVSVAIEALEDGYGATKLSRDKAKRLAAWTSLEEALGRRHARQGRGHRQGEGRPHRHGERHPRLPARLARGHPPGQGHLALRGQGASSSRSSSSTASATTWWFRAAPCWKQTAGAERQQLLETLKEGAVVKGIVKNITDYGAFVDLGGIDGLLHITDLAWRRVKHPSEVLSVGDEVDRQDPQVRPGEEPRLAGHQAAGRGSVGRPRPAATRRARACSARSPTSPTTARSSRSRAASRAWCTSPKWTGPTRTCIPPRWCSWATRSRS